jgi:quercetin dioxygenase-like cupin family protein
MLMQRPSISFADERGEIIDLIEDEQINAVTVVTFRKGAIRGNHYHRQTTQWNYVISGRLILRSESPSGERQDTILTPGDLALIEPDERHALVALEETTLAVFTRGPRGGKEYESDTFRVDPPLAGADV